MKEVLLEQCVPEPVAIQVGAPASHLTDFLDKGVSSDQIVRDPPDDRAFVSALELRDHLRKRPMYARAICSKVSQIFLPIFREVVQLQAM